MLLCAWWRPQLDENRLAALSAPKRTPGYSPSLSKQEPERFLDAGSEIDLLKPYVHCRYKAWWLEVEGWFEVDERGKQKRRPFFAYDAELQRFSEALVGHTSTREPSMQQRIAEKVSEMGMPTDAPTVSRVLAKVRKRMALRFAEHLGRPIDDEYLAIRSHSPEFKELLDEVLEDLGELSRKVKQKQ